MNAQSNCSNYNFSDNLLANPDLCSNVQGQFDCTFVGVPISGWGVAISHPRSNLSEGFANDCGGVGEPSCSCIQLDRRSLQPGRQGAAFATPPFIAANNRYLVSLYVKKGSAAFDSEIIGKIVNQSIVNQFNCDKKVVSQLNSSSGGIEDAFTFALTGSGSTSYKRMASAFSLPQNFSPKALMIYPEISMFFVPTFSTYFDRIEMVEDDFSAGEDITTNCNATITLGGQGFKMISDVEVEYVWEDDANTELLKYRVFKGSDGVDVVRLFDPLFGFQVYTSGIPDLSISSNESACYTLTRTANPDNDPTMLALSFPITSDEICISVAQAGFSVNGNCLTINCDADYPNEGVHSWNFGDLQTGVGSNVEHTYSTAGVYQITHTVTGINNCPAVEVIEVTVPLPVDAGFSYQISCFPSPSATFTANFNPPNSTHDWNFIPSPPGPGAIYNTIGEISVEFSVPGTYSVTHLIETQDCGVSSVNNVLITIPDCDFIADCCPAGAVVIAGHHSLTDLVNEGTLTGEISNQTICLSGRITIDDDYEFQGEINFDADAEIIVAANKTLTLNNAVLKGCNYLWNGIYIEQGGKINTSNDTYIMDAKEAIHAENAILDNITETHFDRNYKGIVLENSSLSIAYGNVFECTETLLTDKSGILAVGAQTYMGIDVNSGTLDLGVTNQTANIFTGVRNGINAFESTLIIRETKFSNLLIDKTEPETYTLMGYGIHLLQGTLNQKGFGKYAQSSFDNCATGIWGSACFADIYNNNMQNIGTGIIIRNSNTRSIKIQQNHIETTRRGIYLLHNDPAENIYIGLNDIDLINTVSVGILVNEMGNKHTDADIEHNTINGNVGINSGIVMLNTTNYEVKENTIHLNTNVGYNGIYVANGEDCLFSCNKIFGTTDFAVGLNVWSTLSSQYECNDFTNLNIGMSFTGECDIDETTNIKGNDFFPPFDIGLYYTESTMINGQEHKGNKWHGNAGDYTDVAAKHDGNNSILILLSQYEVHTTSPPFYPPSINPSAIVAQWFLPDPTGTPETCGEVPPGQSGEDCPAAFIINPKIGEWAIRAAKGEAVSSVYPATALWEMQKALHGSIKENPALLGEDPFVDMFYYTAEGNTMGSFNAIESNTFAAWASSTTELTQIQLLSKQLALNIEDLIVTDVLIAQASSPALLAEREVLLQNIHTQSESMEALFTVVNSNRNNIAVTLKSDNTAILSTVIYENNEKSVNDIYLSTIASGNDDFTAAQKATLLSIAQQCPLEGGNAVFKARALYALVEDMEYDDDVLCGNQALTQAIPNTGIESVGEGEKIGTKPSAEFHLYPNPAKDILTLEYSLKVESHLVIFDIYGRAVMQKTLSPDNINIQINTEGIANGLYLLKVFNTDIEHFTSKIIIQH